MSEIKVEGMTPKEAIPILRSIKRLHRPHTEALDVAIWCCEVVMHMDMMAEMVKKKKEKQIERSEK